MRLWIATLMLGLTLIGCGINEARAQAVLGSFHFSMVR